MVIFELSKPSGAKQGVTRWGCVKFENGMLLHSCFVKELFSQIWASDPSNFSKFDAEYEYEGLNSMWFNILTMYSRNRFSYSAFFLLIVFFAISNFYFVRKFI